MNVVLAFFFFEREGEEEDEDDPLPAEDAVDSGARNALGTGSCDQSCDHYDRMYNTHLSMKGCI